MDTDFFKDFHGAQLLKDIEEVHYSRAECEYERLHNYFKYSNDINIARGLIYLKYVLVIIRRQVSAKIKDDIPLDEIVYKVLLNVVRNYKENHVIDKLVFSRLPQSHLDKIHQALENITDRVPNYFFQSKTNLVLSECHSYDPRQEFKPISTIFYIPLREDLPELDNLQRQKKNNFSLLYVQPNQSTISTTNLNEAYPLETMFECYRDIIPYYDYREFKAIIHTEINSIRSDDELMEYFLETFGYSAFDFLTEIILHRRKKIDYGSVIYENYGKSNKKYPADMIAGQVTVQSEKENILSKRLRKLEKKDKSIYSTVEVNQTEAEYMVAKSTPIFKKAALQKLDPEEYPHVHDQLRNHMVTSR